MSEYHVPVLLKPSVDGLDIRPGGKYMDLTFGGGGHSREILSRMDNDAQLMAHQNGTRILAQPHQTREKTLPNLPKFHPLHPNHNSA